MFIRIGTNRAINTAHIVEVQVGEIDGGKITLHMSTGDRIELNASDAPNLMNELPEE